LAFICAVLESLPIVALLAQGWVVLFRVLPIRLTSKTYLPGVLVNMMNT
jgi:hypothetical protein